MKKHKTKLLLRQQIITTFKCTDHKHDIVHVHIVNSVRSKIINRLEKIGNTKKSSILVWIKSTRIINGRTYECTNRMLVTRPDN